MHKLFLIPLLFLTACNTLQGVAADVHTMAAAVTPDLVLACNTAMTLTSSNPAIAPWIIGGCGTLESINALAADPSSLAWVNSLIAQAQGK